MSSESVIHVLLSFLHRLQKLFYGLNNDPKKINALLANKYDFNQYIIIVLDKNLLNSLIEPHFLH